MIGSVGRCCSLRTENNNFFYLSFNSQLILRGLGKKLRFLITMSWTKKVQLDGRGENILFLRETKKGEKRVRKNG